MLCSLVPVLGLAGAISGGAIQKAFDASNKAYNEGGAVAEEALNAIKTVKVLCTEDKEVSRF